MDPQPPVPPEIPPRRQHPFGPEPRRLGPGAWRTVAIGAGVVALVGAAMLVLLATQSARLLDFALGELEEQVLTQLPEDLGQVERDRLGTAFAGARQAVRERRVGIAGLRRLQDELLGRGPETLTPEEVASLTEALEALAGQAPNRP